MRGVSLRARSREQIEKDLQWIEQAVRAVMPHVERVLIQLESEPSMAIRYGLPLSDSKWPISQRFGEAPCFVILTLHRQDHSLVERRLLANPYQSLEPGKGVRVAECRAGQRVDVVLSRERLHGCRPAYVFRDAGSNSG